MKIRLQSGTVSCGTLLHEFSGIKISAWLCGYSPNFGLVLLLDKQLGKGANFVTNIQVLVSPPLRRVGEQKWPKEIGTLEALQSSQWKGSLGLTAITAEESTEIYGLEV